MLLWLRKNMSESGASMGNAIGGLDAFVNPGAQRAREALEQDNERVIQAPTPGDRLLDEQRIVIKVRRRETD